MLSHSKRYTVLSVLAAGLAVFAISACGGDSDDSGASELAKFAPADAPVYIEGAVQPDSDVAGKVDTISQQLAGTSLGDLIKDGIDSSGKVDFDADVKPWLGQSAAAFVQFDAGELITGPSFDSGDLSSLDEGSSMVADSDEAFGLIVQTSDTDAAQAFIDKQSKSEGGAKDSEYEGFSYKVAADDGSTVGIVDDNVVIGSSEAEFKAAVDASKGDNLADTDTFSDLSGQVADGALASVFTTNDPYLDAMKEGGFDLSGLASALGMDFEGSGSVISLVPEDSAISLQGYSNAGSDLESGDPSAVLETFPANSVFATGSGDVGANATKIMDALNEEGVPGLLKPGEVDRMINEASGQIDIKGIVDSLETVAFFVNGNSEKTLGGALVATSSDIQPIESSLRGISSLMALARDAKVRPLPGGVAGFMVRTADLPGRPIVVGVKGDRLVIGVGMQAALTALGGKGQTLAGTEAYKAADESITGEGLDLFANPSEIAKLIVNAAGNDADARQAAKVIRKFEYVAAGSGDGDDTFEFNLGLR